MKKDVQLGGALGCVTVDSIRAIARRRDAREKRSTAKSKRVKVSPFKNERWTDVHDG